MNIIDAIKRDIHWLMDPESEGVPKMKKEQCKGPAAKFITLAWRDAGGDPFSWEAFNHQVRLTAEIAAAGFTWAEGDMTEVMSLCNKRYGIGKCLGEGGIESLYAIAVTSGNESAIKEIERFSALEPVIADNVCGHSRYTHGCHHNRKRGRVFIGAEFDFGGTRLKANSRKKDGRFNCTEVAGKKRFNIGRDEVISDRKNRKKAKTNA